MIQPLVATCEGCAEAWPGDVQAVEAYLRVLLAGLRAPATPAPERIDPATVPQRIFETLIHRDFCYLSKSRAAEYQEGILAVVRAAQSRREPVPFYFDIGGGYHASLQPGVTDLSFDVGLAELFVVRQIAEFGGRVRRFYPAGVKFSLVIDNLCAYFVNDIPVARTLGYCRGLRRLIEDVGLASVVDVLVEGELLSPADFAGVGTSGGPEPSDIELTSKEYETVEQFLGRPCDTDEAAARVRRYREVVETSERLLAPAIRGVHMTQRASASTIPFRPFPGAA